RAGFMELGNPGSYSSAQHLAPLVWPGCPLVLELHRRPVCPSWLPSPDVDEVFQSAVPSATGVPGLLAPDPPLHALLLMAHSWTHRPLSRLLDLLDLAAVVGAGEPDRADEIAGRWGWRGAWRLALMFVDAV